MRRKFFGLALGALLLVPCVSPQAQQSTKVPRIGFLVASTADVQLNRTDSFRRGLRELGYVEGQNIIIEYRYAGGDPARLPFTSTKFSKVPSLLTSQSNSRRSLNSSSI